MRLRKCAAAETLEQRQLLANIQLAAELYGDSFSAIDEIVELNGKLYVDSWGDLFASGGTQATTSLVKAFGNVTTDELTATSTRLFMRVKGSGYGLWTSGGTLSSTVNITPAGLTSDEGYHVAFGSRLFFAGTSAGSSEIRPWISDGTSAGTVELASVPMVATIASVQMGGKLFFVAGTSGAYKVYRTDGTPSGTQAIYDIPTLFANELGVAGDKLLLSLPSQQWALDASGAGTQIGSLFNAKQLTSWNGIAYFSGNRGGIGSEGWELWRSDGTAAGTYIVKDIYAGSSSNPGYFAAGETRLYFVASTAAEGAEWWLTDGTSAGTRLAGELFAGTSGLNTSSVSAEGYAVVDDTLFFDNDVTDFGPELCQTDGTQAGTRMVENLRGIGTEEWIGSWPSTIRAFGPAVYFRASNNSVTNELFKYSPNNEGTVSGPVFADTNYNAVRDAGEGDMAGVTVYVDANGNSALDDGETSTVSGSDGSYRLYVPAGARVIRAVVPEGMGQSTTSSATNIAAGEIRGGLLIGLYVNTEPTVSLLSTYTVNEGQSKTLSAMATDLEGPIAMHEWDLNYDGSFDVTSTGVAPSFNATALDGPTNRQVAVRVTDRAGAMSAIAVATVEVANVSPTATLSVPARVAVGTLVTISLGSCTDVATSDRATVTYDFDLDGDGVFDVVDSASASVEIPSDYQSATGTRQVRAAIKDDDGGVTVYSASFQVCDLAISNLTIAELVPADSLVGSLSVAGANGVTFAYALVSGDGSDDNAAFRIQGNQLLIRAMPDFETKSLYTVRVRATGGGITLEKQYAISITNVNEAPVVSFASVAIAENAGASALVGTLSSTDPDADDTASFSLAPGENDDDNDLFEIVGNELRAKSSLDYEQAGIYKVRVAATDAGGLSTQVALTVLLNDVNEGPTDLALSGNSVAEGLGGATVGTLTADDPDSGDSLSYALVSGDGAADNSLFQIVDGELRTRVALNFEQRSSYSVRMRATDSGGLWTEQAFTISATNVNERPTALALTGTQIAEGRPSGTVVGQLSATDPDASDTFTYSLVSGTGSADNAKFQIVSGRQLRTLASFDYETKRAYSIRVRVADAGGLFFEKAFAISVTDASEIPASVNGTAGNDTISLAISGSKLRIVLHGAVLSETELALVGAININGGDGDDRVTIASALTAAALIYGGNGNDIITGGAGHDTIYGNFGDDVIAGGAGNDSIMAGLGADSITGGSGADSIWGGDHSDTIRGGDGDDYIEGKGKADSLYGDAGNDTLIGQAGSDLIYGGTGDDRIYVADPAGSVFRDTVYAGAGQDGVSYDGLDRVLEKELDIAELLPVL